MFVRIFDVVVEALNDEKVSLVELNSEFRVSVPDRDLNDILERTEHRADMVDALSEVVSGDVSSFSYIIE